MSIGKTIRILRAAHDLSQGKLARAVGVSPGYLSLVESEKREPSLGFLERVAAHFRLPVAYLLLSEENGTELGVEQRRLLDEVRRNLLDYVISRGHRKRPKQRRRSKK